MRASIRIFQQINMKEIYLDHAASAPMDPRVLEVMLPYLTTSEANPSSLHSPGLRTKEAVTSARKSIADILNCRDEEAIFTSGGTESDNLAIIGITRALAAGGKHVITSAIEHPAVLEPLAHLQKPERLNLRYCRLIDSAWWIRKQLQPRFDRTRF